VNDFANSILCPCCDAQGNIRDCTDDLLTPECRALASIKELRLVEYIFMLSFMGIEFATFLVYIDLVTQEGASSFLQILFVVQMVTIVIYVIGLHNGDMRAWDERVERKGVRQLVIPLGSSNRKVGDDTADSCETNSLGGTATAAAEATSSSRFCGELAPCSVVSGTAKRNPQICPRLSIPMNNSLVKRWMRILFLFLLFG
jgi:hypothetical protein